MNLFMIFCSINGAIMVNLSSASVNNFLNFRNECSELTMDHENVVEDRTNPSEWRNENANCQFFSCSCLPCLGFLINGRSIMQSHRNAVERLKGILFDIFLSKITLALANVLFIGIKTPIKWQSAVRITLQTKRRRWVEHLFLNGRRQGKKEEKREIRSWGSVE